MKTVKSLEYAGLLTKGVSEKIQNKAKEQKAGFLDMLLGKLGASWIRSMLAGKGIIRPGVWTIRVIFGRVFNATSSSH